MNILNLCPFCGCLDPIIVHSNSGNICVVCCPECGVKTQWYEYEEAAAAWNRRIDKSLGE